MKTFKFMVFACIAFASLTFTACSSDDDDVIENVENQENTLPASVRQAFSMKYPGTRVDSWVKKNSYYVVNFTVGSTRAAGQKASAWFDSKAAWKMTESDETLENLPKAVADAFMASDYAAWHVDDIDIVEREGMQTIFVIEVEQGTEEYDLYFLEDGTLIKEVLDEDEEDDDYLPEIPARIMQYLATNFAGFVAIDAEFEDGNYEIEFEHQGIEYEVLFDASCNWISTEYEMTFEQLPDFIREYIQENYPGYEIDDIDVINTKDGTYYEIELENDDDEVILKFNLQGDVMQ